MPELPEVETVKKGLAPHIIHQTITQVEILDGRLRLEVPLNISHLLSGGVVTSCLRRGKYLIIRLNNSQDILAHLGMSGTFIIAKPKTLLHPHDRVVFHFQGFELRYRDPRKFGLILVTPNALLHPLITKLGPEPLSEAFNFDYLQHRLKSKKTSIKQAIMDNLNVVGVGNIYASESLFSAKIHPATPGCHLNKNNLSTLVLCIKSTLEAAILQGGTTLKDFTNSNGKPGYFQQSLQVYGRDGEACLICKNVVQKIKQSGRSSYFCPKCQATK